MAVKLSANPFFWALATLVLAGDDGEPVEIAFKCKFRRLKTSEHKELSRRLAANGSLQAAMPVATAEAPPQAPDEAPAGTPLEAPPVKPINDAELLDTVMLDWKGFEDEAGQPVPYSKAEREATNEAWMGLEAAMVRAYFDNAFPNPRAAAKNSEAPRATS